MLKKFEQIQGNLNEGQQNVFNSVKESVEGNQGKVIFLQGAAGTGKTFLYQACLYWARSRRARAKQQQQQQQQQPLQQNEEDRFSIAVATSGIAATLLPGGRTAHSRFKIPIDLEPNSKRMCGLDDDHVELLRRTDLIVWDEVVIGTKGKHRGSRQNASEVEGMFTTIWRSDSASWRRLQANPSCSRGKQREL